MNAFLKLATAAIALAIPAAAQPQPAPVTVPVMLYSFGYSPAPIVLKAGQPVTLLFINDAGVGHEFSAHRFFHSAKILAGNVGEGDVELKGHQRAAVTLVPARGTYPVHCGHFMHSQL